MALWFVAGIGLVLALMAFSSARRLSKKLESLSHSYWELRYDYTRLRSQVARLDPDQPDAETQPPAAPPPSVTFVPLSSMKRKDVEPGS